MLSQQQIRKGFIFERGSRVCEVQIFRAFNSNLKDKLEMSLQGNSPNPRKSIESSRFQDEIADLQLPQRSRLKIPANLIASQASLKQSQNQEQDEEFFAMELLPNSHILAKQNATPPTSQTFTSQRNDSKNEPKNTGSSPDANNIKTSKNTSQNLKAIDVGINTSERLKWGESSKRTKHEEQSNNNDNNELSECLQNNEQMQMRKKIQEKIKNGYNYDKQGGGLKAKAQQLRRQNQLRERNYYQPNDKDIEKRSVMSTQHNTSMNQPIQDLKVRQRKAPDNPKTEKNIENMRENINTRPTIKTQQIITRPKQLNYQSVIQYYEKQFTFNEAEISDDLVGRSKKIIQEEEAQENGFFSICSCFRSSKRPNISHYNVPMAKRLIAISRKQVTNNQYEEFILKQIWTRLTSKQFNRFGSHWIELGFQGRDPVTDLRSTGVLSLLQWLQFLKMHPKLSEKYFVWSMGHYYPLALTFIQVTDIFLDLLSKGMIKSENWDQFQRCFNCLVLGMFQRLMEKYKLGELVPNFVQNQANEIKGEFKTLLATYDQQFKRLR